MQRHNFFVVEPDPEAHLVGFLFPSHEHSPCRFFTIWTFDCIVNNPAISALIEKVSTHDSGDLLRLLWVEDNPLLDFEFRPDILFVGFRHINKPYVGNRLIQILFFHNYSILHRLVSPALIEKLTQFPKLIPMLHGSLLTSTDEGVDGIGIEGRRAIPSGVHPDWDIRDGKVVLIFVFAVHVHNLPEDGSGRRQLFRRLGLSLHRDTDDEVSSHFPGDVGRKIVAQSTVNEHHVVDPHR